MAATDKKRALPFDQPSMVSPDELALDKENPRLVLAAAARTNDETVIRQLYREDELGELLQSIAANGYLDFEPLVVFRSGSSGKYTVLEGNRRLAAVKLLREPELAEKLAIQTPEIGKSERASLNELRAIRVRSRSDARTFIAFKHINGPHRWDSYAKAKFAARWYREEREAREDASLADIADRIGDRHDTIKRMVGAIYVLEQAETARLFSVDDRTTKRFPFSHLYTALSRTEYMDYLGLEDGWSRWDPKPNPIPASCLDRLGDVLHWIFGYKPDDVLPVVSSQNPDIKRLGEVLTSSAAIAVLRKEQSLSKAYEQTTPADEKLASALVGAQRATREAVSSLQAYDGLDHSLLEIAKEVRESGEIIFERMNAKFATARNGETSKKGGE